LEFGTVDRRERSDIRFLHFIFLRRLLGFSLLHWVTELAIGVFVNEILTAEGAGVQGSTTFC
jgi:hypothetical protein